MIVGEVVNQGTVNRRAMIEMEKISLVDIVQKVGLIIISE